MAFLLAGLSGSKKNTVRSTRVREIEPDKEFENNPYGERALRPANSVSFGKSYMLIASEISAVTIG